MVKLKFQGESVQGGDDGAVEAMYVIDGAASKEAAIEQLFASPDVPESLTHNSYGTLYREAVPQIEEVSQEAGVWLGTVRWATPHDDFSGPDINEPVVGFNTIGGTGHITQSKGTVSSAILERAFEGTPDFHGAIGVSANGDVEGTDIVIPVYEWEETHEVPAATVNRDYRKMLRRLTGTVCDHVFKDFAVGEALFIGASGSQRGRGNSRPWEINLRFAGSENAAEVNIDGLKVRKDGWDYLWVYYVQEESAKRYVPKVAGVFVERVYNRAPWDFKLPGGNIVINNNLA